MEEEDDNVVNLVAFILLVLIVCALVLVIQGNILGWVIAACIGTVVYLTTVERP